MNHYRYWFKIKFKILKEITNLPIYTGIHWSDFFRNELKKFSPQTASEMELNVLPIGKSKEAKNAIISVVIATNDEGKRTLEKWITSTDESRMENSDSFHFTLNKTIALINWEVFDFQPNTQFKYDLEKYSKITLIFPTPLRLKRKQKEYGRFFDPFHFDFSEFISKLSLELDMDMPNLSEIKVDEKSFIWLDVKYKKSIGGIVGGLIIKGKFTQELLTLLNLGQFYGLGKNRTFGFGFYYIKEFPHPFFLEKINNNRIFSFSNIRNKLLEMIKNNDSGTDMTPHELLEYPQFLQKLEKKIKNQTYQPKQPVFYKMKKRNGGFRKIAAYSMVDKLILSLLTDYLDGRLQQLLTSNCYSYRKGYSYHLATAALKKEFEKGFDWGIKLDIASFFDTISSKKIKLLLDALWQNKTLSYLFDLYFKKNLIQGNSLSPMLSNLALFAFDNWFRRQKNLKLIRYADDMVVLGKGEDKEATLNYIKFMLSNLGLKINMDKFMEFSQTSVIDFLGYKISESYIFIPSKKNEDDNNLRWLSYPKLSRTDTKPLYLSFSITYAHTTGNSIYVKSKESITKIPWKEINRILVIGKPRISGGIIYRAIKEQIPIYFLTIFGKPIGGFQVYMRTKTIRELFKGDKDYSYEKFELDFVREITFTKLINQYRLLKKNGITETKLSKLANEIIKCDSIDSIRGKEGFGAKTYYAHFRKLVKPFTFDSRSYHPPKGEINVLLSLGYTLLYRRFAESLNANGINSFEGIFHQGRGTHQALASDMVELYRFLIDRIVISLIKKKQITPENFYTIENSNYLKLDSQGFRSFIRYFEKTMKREIKIKNISHSYEIWIDKTVLSLKNSLALEISFRSYRTL